MLFQRGQFPDNYTPEESFLVAIKRNQNLHKYSISQCFHGACQVTLQICMVLSFALAYLAIDQSTDNSNLVLCFAATLSVLGYVSLHYQSSHLSLGLHLKNFQHVSIFLFFSFSFSPVLYKLTDTISTDTIHTTAGLMLFIHVVFHNFGLERAPVVSSDLSLNAALFASVCLASRLKSSYDAFVLLSFSVVTFVLFPLFRLRLQGSFLVAVTLPTMICAVLLTSHFFSVASGILALSLFGLVLVVTPRLYLHWQGYKQTIHGPWDEAVPNFR